MTQQRIESVVIVGGGTAGWITAAALAKFLPKDTSITLIESEAIGTVGVGEATIPQIRRLNGMLGLNEDEFVRETKGTFKLGIEFNNWGELGESYLHTFGDAGINLASLHFHHYWLRSHAQGARRSLWDFSLHHRAAYANKFGRLDRVGNTSMTGLAYAFHFDAGLYAA
ncbi:MAG: tryptophan 7-halogenase, partial [Pseudomonadota bacterium]